MSTLVGRAALAVAFAIGGTHALAEDAPIIDGADALADLDPEAVPPELPDEDENNESDGEALVGETLVGRRRDARRMVGSATTIDQQTLERFEPDDIHRALRSAPGVYVRDEDGVGLRPNIGLRGASSDRSAKVTLLEDGVLFAPSPYAAPAAYYFPLTTRMIGVEVWKGPAAIRQGPHTIGGAINLRTRPVPLELLGAVDVGFGLVGWPAAGPRGQSRVHGFVGDEAALGAVTSLLDGWFVGGVVEGARVQSDGFKVIDGQPARSTGFVRDDVMLKLRLRNDLLAAVRHTVELKFGVGREESFETYLGLSDADFRADAFRRYAASQDDVMRWWRTQGQVRYGLQAGIVELDVVAYRHDLDRTWSKVNGLDGAQNLHDVLGFADVGTNAVFMSRLQSRAELDDSGAVLIGPNHRTYFSHGVQATLRLDLDVALGGADESASTPFVIGQRLELGARLHQDQITRAHSEGEFVVLRDQLVRVGDDVVTANNSASARAFSAYVADELRLAGLVVVPGARVEVIGGTFTDNASSAPVQKESTQLAVLPGLGAAYDVLNGLTVLAGVHRGFSPVAPGQTGEVRAEESTNGELGVRVDASQATGLSGEVIGFVSHYDNIIGECTFSAGCVDDNGVQQNGGAALIAGAEIAAHHALPLRIVADNDSLQLDASFTFTQARFLTDFVSSHPLFGRVSAGDEMAYLPTLQGALNGAVVVGRLDLGASLGLISAMRDVPGQEPASAETAREWTDAVAVLDVVGSVEIWPGVRLAARADNVLDQRAIVSRRPFGARPGKPRSLLVTLEGDLGE